MKTSLIENIKPVLRDRYVMTLIVIAILFALIAGIYFALSIRVTDLQVMTHYTAFGVTNFYRDKWYYLLNFVGFFVIAAGLHSAIIVKLYGLKGRDFSIIFGWVTLVLLVIGLIIARAVFGVANLS